MKKINIVFAFPLLLLACNYGGIGVFYTVVNEKPPVDRAIDNGSNVMGMAVLGTTLYTANGSFWSLDTASTGSDWSKIGPPASFTHPETVRIVDCASVTVNSQDRVLASLFETVTEADPPVNHLILYDGTGWSDTAYLSDEMETLRLIEIGSEVFLSVRDRTNADYSLFLLQNESLVELSLLSSAVAQKNLPVLDGCLSSGTYYFITEKKIYSGSSVSNLNEISPGGASVDRYISIHASTVYNTIFLAYKETEGSYFIKTLSGTTLADDTGALTYPLTDFFDVFGTTVIGTSRGYLEKPAAGEAFMVPNTGGTVSVTTAVNYSSLKLRETTINEFYYNAASDQFFALTPKLGLWRNTLSSADSKRYWNNE